MQAGGLFIVRQPTTIKSLEPTSCSTIEHSTVFPIVYTVYNMILKITHMSYLAAACSSSVKCTKALFKQGDARTGVGTGAKGAGTSFAFLSACC